MFFSCLKVSSSWLLFLTSRLMLPRKTPLLDSIDILFISMFIELLMTAVISLIIPILSSPSISNFTRFLKLSSFTHFAGKKISGADDANWAVKKDGGDFDQFTGATITPRAVVNAVKRAGLYAQTLPAQLSQLPACGE